jgi:drug/metabolite transporter (DMT)-like permease
MEPRPSIDAFGAISLTAFSFLLAGNQVLIALVNEGLQPVFFAGMRSVAAAGVIAALMLARRRGLRLERRYLGPGLAIGAVFAAEFVCLFLALDLTTVTRTSVIFYSMPVWLAVIGHFVLPGEAMTTGKAAGLALAFAGVAWAIVSRGQGGGGSLAGDLLALGGALAWAGIALIARGTRFREVPPDLQILWQLAVSAPILLAASAFMGPFVRAFEPWMWGPIAGLVAISSVGFMFWLWLLTIYPASGVAAFSFLAPVFGVALGWGLLGEEVGAPILIAAALVVAGLILVNRPAAAAAQVPQKVAATSSPGAGGRA